jgi:predicted nucleotidyltransferase
MTKEITEISELAVQSLIGIFKDKLDRIILFGSYSRGDFDEDSDIDIMVLVNEEAEKLKKYDEAISELISDYCIKYGVLYSIVIKSKNQFDYYSGVLPFYKNIVSEGFVLYGRQN